MTIADTKMPTLQCRGCNKTPGELAEYVSAASPDSYGGEGTTPDDYVREEEGTLDPETGLFLCTECYISAGMPLNRGSFQQP